MQIVGIKKGGLLFCWFSIVIMTGLMFGIWILADLSDFVEMICCILSVVVFIPMICCTIWFFVAAYRYYVIFYDTVLEYSNGDKVHKNIAYHRIKKVQFRGVKIAGGFLLPFYDLLDDKQNVLCTIKLFMVDIDNLTQLFVERGITVEDKDGQTISSQKILTGENIHTLQEKCKAEKYKEFRLSEWLGSLNYAQVMKIYLLIVFGWNSYVFAVPLGTFGGKAGIAILGGVLAVICSLSLMKKRWELLFGFATIIFSTIIGLILCMDYLFSLGYYSFIIMLIAGIFLLACALKATGIPLKKKRILLLGGIAIMVLCVIGICYWIAYAE